MARQFSSLNARRNRPTLTAVGGRSPHHPDVINSTENRYTREGRAAYIRRRRDQRSQVGHPTRRRHHDVTLQGNGRPNGDGLESSGLLHRDVLHPAPQIQIQEDFGPLSQPTPRPVSASSSSSASRPVSRPGTASLNTLGNNRTVSSSTFATNIPSLANSSSFATRFGRINGERSRRGYSISALENIDAKECIDFSYRHGGGVRGTIAGTGTSHSGIRMVNRPVPVEVDGVMVDMRVASNPLSSIAVGRASDDEDDAIARPRCVSSPNATIGGIFGTATCRGTTEIVEMDMEKPKESTRPLNTYRGKDPVKRAVQNKKLQAILSGRKLPVDKTRTRDLELKMGEKRVLK